MQIKSSFDEVIILDNGDQVILHAGEGEFLNMTLSNGGGSVTVSLDSIAGSRISRMMQLLYYNQIEATKV